MSLAAIITGPNKVIFDEVEVREPEGNEVKVRITAVGICGTDVTAISGYTGMFPSVAGHEGAGIIEAVGPDVTKFKVGDRVGITYSTCGECKYCKAGKPSLCDIYPTNFFSPGRLKYKNMQVPNWFGQNSFANVTLTTERNLTKVPEGLDPDIAGPFHCGVITGVGSMAETGAKEGDVAIVFGMGTVGLSAVMEAKRLGCSKIIAASGILTDLWKEETARAVGATDVIISEDPVELEAEIRKIAPGGGDAIVEASGHNPMCEVAVKTLAKGGTLYFAAVYKEPIPFKPNMMVNGTYKHGGMGEHDPVAAAEELMQACAAGELPVDKLIKFYRFDEMEKALDDFAQQKVIKAVLKTE